MALFDLNKLQRQDAAEWQALCTHFEERLFRFVRRYSDGIDEDTAWDIVQDTLVAAHDELCCKNKALQEEGLYLTTWIHGICKNRCRNFLRETRSHQSKNDQLLVEHSFQQGAQAAAPLPDPGEVVLLEGVDECLDCLGSAEARDLVLACLCLYPREAVLTTVDCLNRLKPLWRSVLLLRYIAELKYREIADLLDISLESVKSRLYDAHPPFRQRLREKMRSPLFTPTEVFAP